MRTDRSFLRLDTLAFRRAMLKLKHDDPERASRLRAERARLRTLRHEGALDEEGKERKRASKRAWWSRVGSERRRQARA
jgi:hypothetical protein